MGQRIVRLALVGGVLVLALLLLLAMCAGGADGGGDDGAPERPRKRSAGPATRLNVPREYTTGRGWEVVGAGPDYAVSHPTGRLGYLVRTPDGRYRLRTLDAETGRAGWHGEALTSADPERFPKLITVAKDDRQFFVTWSLGRTGDALTPAKGFVSLDVYDVEDGGHRHVEVPWTGVPAVTATGPGVLITDGSAAGTVVDPVDGGVSAIGASAARYPEDCPACEQLTEVRGQTAKGLLLSGSREFWVRGGWFSRRSAPPGADPRSGIPTSVVPGLVLARWQPAAGTRQAATHQIWTVHDTVSGKPVVSVRCHRPAMEPGTHPQAVLSPSARYLVAGNLAFDLTGGKAFCFEDEGGAARLTFASVTDGGSAYGATDARDADEALRGGTGPVSMSFPSWDVEALPPNTRLPDMETAGTGVFRWTDRKDRLHLIGYPRTG
ncbi:hypothetical protein OHT61_09435 [Streptomyces sp. NBC_00178]|uniref:hypothetical protein n=1 Tax=Streptomyces sp. NBC_00178 TaxID=2975672 RepID=UPI002E2B498A|nr:hypothetical protein [Streptomyces sp. NBC_00178]